MIRKPILLTLTWRWRTLWCLPLWGFAFVALLTASAVAESAIQWVARLLTGESGGPTPLAIRDYLPNSWLAGVGLGLVVAWIVHELLRCPISATLPGLRRRLAVEVGVGLAIAWVLLIRATVEHRDPAVHTTCAAIGFVGVGVGLVIANPARFRTWRTECALVLGLPPIAHLLELSEPWILEHASVVVPTFAVIGVGAVALAFSAGEHRRLLAIAERTSTDAVDPVVLDVSHRDRRAASRWAPTWKRGRDWARATLYELHGASALGWSFDVSKYVVLFVVLVVLVITDGGPRGMSVRTSIWHAIGQNAVGEEPVFWRTILSFWLLVTAAWAASVPCVPRVGVVRPTSRAERARSAWSVVGLRTGALLGGVTLLTAVIGAVALWRSAAAGDRAIPVRGLPDLLGAIAIVGIVAPWAAWIRLRLLDLWTASGRFPNPFRQGVVAMATVVACEVAGHLLGSAWFAAEEAHPAFAPLLFAPALVGSWLAYRAVLDRLFRTVALPV